MSDRHLSTRLKLLYSVRDMATNAPLSILTFCRLFPKDGTALVIWLFGVALEMRGYITPSAVNPLPVQPPEAVQAVRYEAGVVPAILLIGAIIFAYLYPITRDRYRSIRELLAERLTAE